MQIYANLFQKNKNATSLFLGRFLFCLFYLIGLGGGFKTSTQNFENHSVALTLPPLHKKKKRDQGGVQGGHFNLNLFTFGGEGVR